MLKQIIELEVRNDPAGSGIFGARRGDRTHRGMDFTCTPGQSVLSPVNGILTRLGYPYGDNLAWRYVEITTKPFGHRHRFFYVEPHRVLEVGDPVSIDHMIGFAQDITQRYPGQEMTPHIHYEVKDQEGNYLDPEDL